MNLYELSRTILLVHKTPISKVRFARVIYFIHKELIRKKLMSAADISYIRSPLGPVPDGFMSLTSAKQGIISQKHASSHLSYTNEEYTIDHASIDNDSETDLLEQYKDVLATIERTLKALHDYTTPELVEATHHDPSWQSHSNGEIYQISATDLKNLFPFLSFSPIRIKIRFGRPPTTNKAGALQAKLLRGMISDIVKESTDLEYPDDPATNVAPKPTKPRKIFRIKIFQSSKKPKNTEQNPNKPKGES